MLESTTDDTATAGAAADGPTRAGSAYVLHRSDDWDAFNPFGLIIRHRDSARTRSDYSGVFESLDIHNAPRLHVNHVDATRLPVTVSQLERHPSSWQTFLPLDVSRYVVCVAGARPDGSPDTANLHVWILDGTVGVSFAPGIWHAGAAVLDTPGHFAVIWPRADRDSDTEFLQLPEPFVIH
ncbi:ureidoglycolate lyase [Microvirga antarctica]|uniref:ureidoglycolate lyase n=1 Tax=Microvirga antarctica TaxID=2819233 RepID=UPI001B3098E3|nr:ureidoglycolate lyase [Microvirga antarctica]